MNLRQKVVSTACCVALLACFASTARAQSAIAGNVKDATGAVLPGVTVEASSPALIERARSAVTDDQGLYQITNLPPGTYRVSFSLTGFVPVNRENLQLPGDFTATVSVELRVGGIEESVTVSGASPVVDVQSTAKAQVVTRELLDVLPTGKTVQTMAALIPGVITFVQDVGGSGSMNQNFPMAHGMGARETVVMLDGITLKTMLAENLPAVRGDCLSNERRWGGRIGRGRSSTHRASSRRQRVPRELLRRVVEWFMAERQRDGGSCRTWTAGRQQNRSYLYIRGRPGGSHCAR